MRLYSPKKDTHFLDKEIYGGQKQDTHFLNLDIYGCPVSFLPSREIYGCPVPLLLIEQFHKERKKSAGVERLRMLCAGNTQQSGMDHIRKEKMS